MCNREPGVMRDFDSSVQHPDGEQDLEQTQERKMEVSQRP